MGVTPPSQDDCVDLYDDLPSASHTRVLEVQPGNPDDEMHARLVTVNLTDPDLEYEALSYSWDNESPSRSVRSGGTEIRVTAKVWDALVHLRHPEGPRWLWIDQVSISQTDIPEKSSQVSMMSTIFSRASRVIIWLGLPCENTELAFDFLRNVSSCNAKELYSKYQIDSSSVGEISTVPSLPSTVLLPIAALHNWFEKSWFHRRWTFQEFMLASDRSCLMSGNLSISLPDYIHALRRLELLNYQPHLKAPSKSYHGYVMSIAAIDTRQDAPIVGTGTLNLDVVLKISRDLQCFDDRDRIYAILSLCKQDVRDSLETDYNISVPDLYCKATKAAITSSQSLSVLSRNQACGQRASDLPSWVPDFRDERHLHGFDFSYRAYITPSDDQDDFRYFSACGDRSHPVSASERLKQLTLYGHRVGQISRKLQERVSLVNQLSQPTTDARWKSHNWRQWYHDMVSLMAIPLSCVRNSDRTADGFYQYLKSQSRTASDSIHDDDPLVTTVRLTTTANHYPKHLAKSSWGVAEKYRFQLYRAWERGQKVEFMAIAKEMDKLVDTVMRSRDLYIVGHDANDSYLCAADMSAAVGDWVVLLHGGDAPFVIRERGGSSIQDSSHDGFQATPEGIEWEFVCDTYVHGIMYGEFVQDLDPANAEAFTLV